MLVNSLLRLFEISIATSFLILPLCLASRRINRRYGAKWKYYIWLLLAVRLMIPVNLPAVNGFSLLPDLSQRQQIQTQEQPIQSQAHTGSQPETVPSQSQEQEQPISEPPYSIDGTKENTEAQPAAIMNVTDIAAIVWCVGFCVFSVFQLYVYYAFRRGIFVDGRECENSSIHELVVSTSHAIGLHRTMPVIVSRKVNSPMILGIFRPVLVIPREDYRIDTVLCGDEDFAIACMKTNLAYNKNLSRGDVKTHHYIISFDPRDAEDNGLTMDRAHELGLEFCKKHFPGHQALVATHPDGHNKSGNIHVHIVINSLRIERVPRMPYMDKDCDMLPGMKHRCTSAALRYFRAEVMEMCQREGLYQIDLLNGSNNRITEREYWAQKQGQKKLDEENAELIANGEEPKQTKFETDKQILRQQIRAALQKSKSLEDFFDYLLEDYGIAVKESRGRFSYLTPERSKPITSRKLGDDFSKEAILAALEQNAKQIIPSVTQRPDTFVTPAAKPEIEKLIDLEAKRAEGKGEGYIHWGTVFNLKTMAKTLLYLQENGLTDLDALDAALEESHENTNTARTDLKKIEAELNAKKELQRHVLNARDAKDLHMEYMKLPTPNTVRAKSAKRSCRPSKPILKKCSGCKSRRSGRSAKGTNRNCRSGVTL